MELEDWKISVKNLFLYQALQRQAYLVANSEGIAIDGEVGICLQLLEVEADGAVDQRVSEMCLPWKRCGFLLQARSRLHHRWQGLRPW